MTTSSVVRGRRWLAVLVAGVTVAGAISVSAAPGRADAAVQIPDAQFKSCLDKSLGKADGADVTAAELASITQLYCIDPSAAIADLTGARYLSSVNDLSLAGNAVTSIAELKDLSTLEYLDLSRNQLTSIEGVYGLTNLKELRLSSNSISNIDGLANITDPELIDVSSNKLADLSALKDFTGTTVFADGEKPQLAVVVGASTAAGIKARSGDPITHFTKTEDWAALKVSGATITADKAGVYDLDFAEKKCSSAGCDYSFNGTVTVVAAVKFSAAPAPTISGKGAIGRTLTAKVSNWSPQQLDWTYQWYRNDIVIAGAVASTYKVTAADAGWRLKVALTGVLDGYASVSSKTIDIPGIAFTKVTRPKITGTARIGKILTAKTSGWSPTPDSWTYQWYRNSKAIAGAVAATHTLVGSDRGKRITVKVIGIKPGYKPTSKTSKATSKVSAGKFDTDKPTITGIRQVGQTLTATAPEWEPSAGHWYYQWYRNNKRISHATKPSYTLIGSDVGKGITVRMTATRSGFTTAKRTSSRTMKVLPGQFSAAVPTITKVGNTLTVVSSGWSPTPSHVDRQWYRDGSKIAKATKATYLLTGSDLGHSFTVEVTGAKKGYVSLTKTTTLLISK